MNPYHLAQINIAKAKASMDSEIMKGFVSRLNEINALADKSKGFVWRLQDEVGNTSLINAFNNPLLLINMSVWQDIVSLKNFVYKSQHVELIRDRDAWFNKMIEVHQTLWWVKAGHIPTIAEGKEKLACLQKNGVSKTAFTFARAFKYSK